MNSIEWILSNVKDSVTFEGAVPSSHEPKQILVRDLDFNIQTNASGIEELDFFYSQAYDPININGKVDFDKILPNIANRTYALKSRRSEFIDDKSKNISSMSLNNKFNRYIVFRLSNKNWQFASTYVPFMMEKRLENSGIFYQAGVVDPGGLANSGLGTVSPVYNRKTAYFVSLGAAGNANQVNYPYPHSFNMNVELTRGNNSYIIPVIVDPDIRYPGGNTLTDPPE